MTQESLSYWQEREEKIFARRDEYEAQVTQIIGWELTPMQFLQLRNAIAGFETCEQGIERVQEQMNYWHQRKVSV